MCIWPISSMPPFVGRLRRPAAVANRRLGRGTSPIAPHRDVQYCGKQVTCRPPARTERRNNRSLVATTCRGGDPLGLTVELVVSILWARLVFPPWAWLGYRLRHAFQ